ncbi:MAG TPA: hypothetical protein VFH37_02475 [Candidatus Saccharimonadales bacterium]|nr:hypothetical protein [Candidatus Saccharimonadales bacterium]
MPEPEGSPEPTQNKQEDLDKEASHRARKLLATSAALASAATLAVTASQPNRSAHYEAKSAVATDVSFDQYGKDGHAAPQITMLESQDPSIENVTPVPSNNPYEYAQQMLYIAANTDPKKIILNHIAYGLTVVLPPGTVLYHSVIGSRKFMPAKPNPNNDGKADKFVVRPGEYLVWENPRYIAIAPDEQVWYAGNLATDANMANRATDVSQNYFFSVNQAYEHKAQYFSHKGEPVQLLDGIVNSQGNLELGDVPAKELSVFRTVSKDELGKMKTQRVLLPTMNPPSAGR